MINVQNDQDNVLCSTLQRSHHVDISAEGKYETIQFVQRPKFSKVRYSTGHDNVLLFKLRCQDGVLTKFTYHTKYPLYANKAVHIYTR